MLTAAVSTIALVLALGPQIQVGLQAALQVPEPAVEETVAETPAPAPVGADTGPVETGEPEVTLITQPEETSETPVETMDLVEEEVIDPIIEAEPVQIVTTPDPTPVPVQSGAVPEADWPAILADASAALSAAKTAKGNFVQSNADRSIVTGTFALNRPGRMRFDYDDPTPILIVSDGTTVAMEDSELETVDRVPIGSTPLDLILSTRLDVDQDIEVLSVLQDEDRIGIRVSDASGELEGTLTMVFDKKSYDLLGWLAVDGNLQTTVVDLTDVETNVRIDPRLFRLDEAEDEEDER